MLAPLELPSDVAVVPGQLVGRRVLVVGAAGGLGRAVCEAAGAAGATVVLLGRKVPKLEAIYDALVAAGAPRPAIYPLDLSGASPHDYLAMANTLNDQLGGLDGVVLAQADFDARRPSAQIDPNVWLRQLHVNLAASWLIIRYCLPLLLESSHGRIVGVLDDPDRIRAPWWGAYGVAQGGLEVMLSALAAEFANSTLRVHALDPGKMATPLRAKAYMAEVDGEPLAPARVAAACVYALAAGADTAPALIRCGAS